MRRRSRSGGAAVLPPGAAQLEQPLSIIRAFDHETNPSRPVRPSPLASSNLRGMPLDFVERIRSFPIFASAPDSFLAAISAHLHLQVYSPQSTILTEGDVAKAMYWLVRGTVIATSRDRESTYAELKPGSFFGEIGILMNIPRTASIVARHKCLVIRLNKEDLKKELPNYPEVERAIREEAQERLAFLQKKRRQAKANSTSTRPVASVSRSGKRTYEDDALSDADSDDGSLSVEAQFTKRRRKSTSPQVSSPSLIEAAATSGINDGSIYIRELLRELPLFSNLPDDILHFVGLNAQPRNYAPFIDIVQQGSEGREIYFITKGDVEVFTDSNLARGAPPSKRASSSRSVKARLKTGQYFGEVTSLALAPLRTACVRSVTETECLVISGAVIDELLRRCSPDVRRSVEMTAKSRLRETYNAAADVQMLDADGGAVSLSDLAIADTQPKITLDTTNLSPIFHSPDHSPPTTPSRERPLTAGPVGVDVFFNADRTSLRPVSTRRKSYSSTPTNTSPLADGEQTMSTFQTALTPPTPPRSARPPLRPRLSERPKYLSRTASHLGKGRLPDSVLVRIWQYLDVRDLTRLRAVSVHWSKLLSTSPYILHHVDLSQYNRKITDHVLISSIAPFISSRPREIDISNCFHITDDGFAALVNSCSLNIRTWKMRSVWDISPQSVLDMANKAKDLRAIDFSNCRKVSDNLLARTVGWVVRGGGGGAGAVTAHQNHQQQLRPNPPPPTPPDGTVIGCPKLTSLTLSYCKHVTDRFMAHLALHTADRLEDMDITRCTTITDIGFRHWGEHSFPRLKRLVLADCTYLTDGAIICLTRCTSVLQELDLSFCCALSDTAIEALSTGCPSLQKLNVAFCGSAVSDSSMMSIGLGLHDLREISVRGCVRVTGAGVEAVLDGCARLEAFDVSQCKSLRPWLDEDGVRRFGRGVHFETVADGLWRVHGAAAATSVRPAHL